VAVGEEHAAREERRRVRFRAGSTSLLVRSQDGISSVTANRADQIVGPHGGTGVRPPPRSGGV